jgi:tetratricopeptide (TPR) repeat protein
LRPLRAALVAIVFVFALAPVLSAQAQAADVAESSAQDRGRILLVLPFDNRSGQPSLEWVREAAADLLGRRFGSAGFAPMQRTDRRYALDHLGLPENFHPSRASSIKLAQTLDADSIIVGSFLTDGSNLVAEARVVNLTSLHMSEPVRATGPMRSMVEVFDVLAWKLTRQLDPKLNVAQETFIAAGKDIRVDAYEQYIRGVTEQDQTERLHHLQQAIQLNPAFGAAWMALGSEQYNMQKYDEAATAFAKVGRDDRDALEASFYRGISQLFSGDYPGAEQSFAAVAHLLPLAEVLNNQGVAVSRQNHDGTDLFIKAEAADPSSADYHFNLAISLKRHNQMAGAINELAQALKLHPADYEAQSLMAAWKSQNGASDATIEPLERIERTFDEAAFRQAAQMMDQMDEQHMAALAPVDRARKLATQADEYLDRGQLLEAERLFQAAITDDEHLAAAHVGLAEIRERSGAIEDARKEAQIALQLEPANSAAQDLLKQTADHTGQNK